MQDNLVIVESPAKAKTIEKFLGKDYKVMSSYGHIRDLNRHDLSIDTVTFEPKYEVPDDKTRVVRELKSAAKKAKTVWLASDEDREGEAISWHLCEVLGLDEATTRRIVFHEITKTAIADAILQPRHIDMNLANAQQARRVLDRLVGFNLSPILWRKVKPSLSAGRVQSVAVRLIVEREREVQAFKPEAAYRVTAIFDIDGHQVKAELDHRYNTQDEARAFLEQCRDAVFTITTVQRKPLKRSPAPPFTTSTLQQEAARKLGYPVAQTMRIAQKLYEDGRITYMRTDSVNLSKLCIGTAKEAVTALYGEQYSKSRNYTTHTKGAQEAHEAIRPTYMDQQRVEGTAQEQRLYDLIWKRTAATQMADAQIEKTTVDIDISTVPERKFVATGEAVIFDGFLRAYAESRDDDEQQEDLTAMPANIEVGQQPHYHDIVATERYTQGPARYTEASLVHKLEELGIGRPSTYAPTISTIQQREYVAKGDQRGTERQYTVLTLKGGRLTTKQATEMAGSDKGKLRPTDVGTVVNDFLIEHFPDVLDYNFTANVEKKFDAIAEGQEEWHEMIRDFYAGFEPVVQRTLDTRTEHKAGERELGTDPKSGRKVLVKIGRFGPVAQIGTVDDDEKPRFAQVPKTKSIETITLEEALELFRLPRTVGESDGEPVVIGAGRFGPYVLYKKKYTSLPKGADPHTITLAEALQVMDDARKAEAARHLKRFDEDPKMEIINGRYGPYIAYDGKNFRIPKARHADAAALTYQECLDIVKPKKEKEK